MTSRRRSTMEPSAWVVTKDTRRLLEFIKDAFDAEERGGNRWRAGRSGTPRRGSATRSS